MGQPVHAQQIAPLSDFEPLSSNEIEAFFREIDADGDGFVTLGQLEAKLAQVYDELTPKAREDVHAHHPQQQCARHRQDLEKKDQDHGPGHESDRDRLHTFLSTLMPNCSDRISKEEFIRYVRSWNVPSATATNAGSADATHRMSWYRKVSAQWCVAGRRIIFLVGVSCLTLGIFLWQGLHAYYNPPEFAAFGWGVVVAKFCAGALYPIFFFMLLSTNRWFSTAMRKIHSVRRAIDWDYSQAFHVGMASVGLFFSTLHGIGHLAGTFVAGSQPDRQAAVAVYLGPGQPSYVSFLKLIPGWSGIVALALYWIIMLLALPRVRSWSYELFQLSHLLMFPFFGLICAHGTQKILQYPMLGFWLSFPIFLVLFERIFRTLRGFLSTITARVTSLDDESVTIVVRHPRGKVWTYRVGQFVLLQVPQISYFQWHPFTISACLGDELHLHIKTEGNWTGRLQCLSSGEEIKVGIDGPFGAPADRFYDFDRSIIIGAGVGVTPFSAIITNIEKHLMEKKDPWAQSRRAGRAMSRNRLSRGTEELNAPSAEADVATLDSKRSGSIFGLVEAEKERRRENSNTGQVHRRVDFHWMVRDKSNLLWFSALLNRAYELSLRIPRTELELNIATHITTRQKDISSRIFYYLLDAYRTPTLPVSALTGLKIRSRFGRPDLRKILMDFYRDEVEHAKAEVRYGNGNGNGNPNGNGKGTSASRVGVFFCGNPAIGRILADTCTELTAKGRMDGSRITFVFLMEVFG